MSFLEGYRKAGITTVGDMNQPDFWYGFDGLIVPSDKKIEQTTVKKATLEGKEFDITVSTIMSNGISNNKCWFQYPFLGGPFFEWNSAVWNDSYPGLDTTSAISEIPIIGEQLLSSQNSPENNYISYKFGFGVLKDGGFVVDYKECENSIQKNQSASVNRPSGIEFSKFNSDSSKFEIFGSYNSGSLTMTNFGSKSQAHLSFEAPIMSYPVYFFAGSKINPDLYDSSSRLPDGLTYTDGILKIEPDQESKNVGIEVVGLFKIDNKSDGTNSNFCLESSSADYLIKEASISYIDVNDSGLDETYNVQYILNESTHNCTLSKANDSSIAEYSTFNNSSVVRKISTGDIYQIMEIGRNGFKDFIDLKLDTLPKNITNIGSNGFYKCTHLGLKEFPPHLISIGDGSFQDSSVEISSFPATFYDLGIGCFNNTSFTNPIDCTKLTKLDVRTASFAGSINCVLRMTQELADSLGSRIAGGKIDSAVVEIVEPEEIA